MEITFELTKKDYADFNRYWFLKKNLLLTLFLLVVMSIALPFILSPSTRFSTIDYLKFSLLAFVILGFIYLAGITFVIAMFKSVSIDKSYSTGTKSYVLNHDGIIENTAENGLMVKWPDVTSFNQSKSLFILSIKGKDSIVIPKRSFSDPEEANKFIQLIQAKLQS